MIELRGIIWAIGIGIGLLHFQSVIDWQQEKHVIEREEDSILETKGLEEGTEEAEIEKIVEAEYIESKRVEGKQEHNDIQIYYPQLSEGLDSEKESRVNFIIEEDAKRLLKLDEELRREGNLKFYLKNDAVFSNEKIISISYKGYVGATYFLGAGYSNMAMATTICLEEEKILTLNDVITDVDKFCDLLLEDQFQDITLWERTEVSYSQQFPSRLDLEEELEKYWNSENGDYYCVQWYIDGEDFIFVRLWGKYYYEYAIKIEKIKELLSEEFLSLLN